MCCFSPVAMPIGLLARILGGGRPARVRVARTRIHARMHDDGTQSLAYSMTLSVRGDVAMILPLPVRAGLGDEAVRFVNLEKYPGFFDDLREGFVMPMMLSAAKGGFRGFAPRRQRPRLKVHAVGAFVASYVPSRGDFDRLDPRFRLPDEVWARLGNYADWGFAVFQLGKGRKQRIHPMAMRFPTRDPARIFFPTVHIHDGKVHPTARFDHTLFYQHPALRGVRGWDPLPPSWNDDLVSPRRAGEFMRMADVQELLAGDEPAAMRSLSGELANEDTWIPLELPAREGAAPVRRMLFA